MIEAILETGLSLGFDFDEIPKLQNARSILQWCNKALSFCSVAPALPGIESLMEYAEHLPVTCASSALCSSLIDGVKWLKKASEVIPVSCNGKICKLSDAEEVLSEVQRIKVSFPLMVGTYLDNDLHLNCKCRLWKEQILIFFGLKTEERSWSKLLQLKELGKDDAFSCCELDMVLSETEKVEKWKLHCMDIVGHPVGDVNSLLDALVKIKHTLDRSLYIYKKSRGCNPRDPCIHCFSDIKDQELLTCSICKDCYHLQCLGATLGHQSDAKAYVCSYCQFIGSGSFLEMVVLWYAHLFLARFGGKRPELNMLIELLSDAEGLCVG
ncbi:hypothetical protein CK203_067733 [Vitis vinifera]|uniref:Lysine-specific demethylase-like domain-containing protein n=1 Tax=Vitis vinifera TaxID=29760 RepID=A0A438BZC6_VITVI|nr:hypothetical protein CK203_067733 [Vitis vinifera]